MAIKLPAFVALLVATSSVSASAQLHDSFAGPNRTPGHAVESIMPNLTVVSTNHYQAELTLTCSSNACDGNFPAVAANRRLHLERMNCTMGTTGVTTAWSGQIALYRANNSYVLSYWLLPGQTGGNGAGGSDHVYDQPINLQLLAGQYIWIRLLASGNAYVAYCTASGTMDAVK